MAYYLCVSMSLKSSIFSPYPDHCARVHASFFMFVKLVAK